MCMRMCVWSLSLCVCVCVCVPAPVYICMKIKGAWHKKLNLPTPGHPSSFCTTGVMNAVGPLQLVAIRGKPIAMAST